MPDEIAARIREMRKSAGMTYAALASRAGIKSPSYVFHIENGTKTPSPDVAGRIGAALGDDPAVYRAWAQVRTRSSLAEVLAAADILRRSGIAAGSGGGPAPEWPAARVSAPVSAADPESPTEPVPAGSAAVPGMFRVPVLPEGADPDSGPAGARPIEVLDLDARLLPPGAPPVEPFAYRLSAHGARRLPDVLQPGDCVVVSREGEPPAGDACYAVRAGSRVEISRVRMQEGALLLPFGAHGDDAERIPTPRGRTAADLVIGRVVAVVRRWL